MENQTQHQGPESLLVNLAKHEAGENERLGKIYAKALRKMYELETENLVTAIDIHKKCKEVIDGMFDEILSISLKDNEV